MTPFGPNRVALNPSILRWARERRNISLEQASGHMNKSINEIQAWESGDKTPTVNQARELAKFYDRPFLDFLMEDIPNVYTPGEATDFRRHVTAEQNLSQIEITEVRTWIESMRQNTLDLFEETGESIPSLPSSLVAGLSEPPNLAARRIREAIGLTWDMQSGVPSDSEHKFPKILRELFEKNGILTLRSTRLSNYGIRGISVANMPLPTVVITSESPTAQAFSLAHELGHIVLRASGISGFQLADPNNFPTEKWCDAFAANFLLPTDYLIQFFGQKPSTPASSVRDDLLNSAAKKFKVSPEVLLIHLVELKYVQATYYWDVKKPQFIEANANARHFGRAPYWASRYRNASGEMYTGLVLEAWATGKITNHGAAEFLGVKKANHLNDIRKNFYESA